MRGGGGGINPLYYKKVKSDLSFLPKGKKAILYFHFGKEHVRLPPYENILLVKKLLDDERVLLIIGVHPHRIQGNILHNGKYAFMSIGNFLYPNCFILPPYHTVEEPGILKNIEQYKITREEHNVKHLTYKKTCLRCRISMVIRLDTETYKIDHKFTFQDDNIPKVKEINNFLSFFIEIYVCFLSMLYKFPCTMYKLLEKLDNLYCYTILYSKIFVFQIMDFGILCTTRRAFRFLRRIFHLGKL